MATDPEIAHLLKNIGGYTDEEAQDAVGGILETELVYDDAAPSIGLDESKISHDNIADVTPSDHHTRPSAGNALTEDGSNNFNVDESAIDHDNISGVTASDHHTRYSDEEAQDSVGSILGANFTYDDVAPSITLTSDTVTIAGNSVSLGGSTSVAHSDLTGIGPSDHHTRYSDEEAQDAVGTILGSLFTYDDTTPSITLDEGEISHDAIDQTTVSASDHHTRYADEEAQDAVGTILDSSFTYDDATPSISISSGGIGSSEIASGAVGSGELNDEEVQDFVGAMAGDNLTYDDTNGVIDASGGGSGDPVDIQEGGTDVVTDATDLNFIGTHFNITNPSAGVADAEINLGISPTWTGQHTFGSVMTLTGNHFDFSTNDIRNLNNMEQRNASMPAGDFFTINPTAGTGDGDESLKIRYFDNSIGFNIGMLELFRNGPHRSLNKWVVTGGGPNNTGKLEFSNTSGIYEDSNGEVVGVDSAGNTTVLT